MSGLQIYYALEFAKRIREENPECPILWTLVVAREASLSFTDESLSFTSTSEHGSDLFRGWEKARGKFAWAGIGYRLGPERTVFAYTIKVALQK
ncbi:hypothetical protein G4O51_01365 [Candidatus Bathyarchaeota archaeon A05DMB-2]|nr:hypothetical protein [Candidatus Bathyarchaeota archaeon A05DMB-2]